jgi:hypothetical protein
VCATLFVRQERRARNQAAQDELLKATHELTKNLETVKEIVRKSLTGTTTPLT